MDGLSFSIHPIILVINLLFNDVIWIYFSVPFYSIVFIANGKIARNGLLAAPNAGFFSRRWPLFGPEKDGGQKIKKQFFLQGKFYSLTAQAHYFTVLIYLATWRAAKLGFFTHFTFTNLPRCSKSMTLLIYVYTIQIPSCWIGQKVHHNTIKNFSKANNIKMIREKYTTLADAIIDVLKRASH